MKQIIFNGTKGIGLEQYPSEAWVDLSPTGAMSGRDSREELEAVHGYYDTVAWLYRCIEIRSNALIRVPWSIRRGDTDVWESEEKEPPQQLEFLSKLRHFLWLTEACLCLSPEAFWFRERNRVRTTGVKWHMPGSVLPVWDEEDGLVAFERMANGKKRRFDVEDYVYFPRPNPLHETQPGRPPAQAAMSSAGVLFSVDTFSTEFFRRGAIKATLLTVDGTPPQAEMERLEAWWKRFFSGSKSAWNTAAVRMGVKPEIIGEGLEGLSNNELTKDARESITTGMGIPMSLVFSRAANFQSKEDTLNFYDLTVVPEIDMIFNALNEQLFSPMGLTICHRADEMTVFQEDEQERSQAFGHYVSAGMKQSVAAQILGIDLPPGMEYEDLDPEEEELPEEPIARLIEPEPLQIADGQQIEEEKSRFRRWAKKRNNVDPDKFNSGILTDTDKAAILYELHKEGEQATTGATFPVWESYP